MNNSLQDFNDFYYFYIEYESGSKQLVISFLLPCANQKNNDEKNVIEIQIETTVSLASPMTFSIFDTNISSYCIKNEDIESIFKGEINHINRGKNFILNHSFEEFIQQMHDEHIVPFFADFKITHDDKTYTTDSKNARKLYEEFDIELKKLKISLNIKKSEFSYVTQDKFYLLLDELSLYEKIKLFQKLNDNLKIKKKSWIGIKI